MASKKELVGMPSVDLEIIDLAEDARRVVQEDIGHIATDSQIKPLPYEASQEATDRLADAIETEWSQPTRSFQEPLDK